MDDWVRPDGTPIYSPVGSRHPGWQRYTSWDDLGPWGKQLRGLNTKHVYMSPDGRRLWNLSGNWAGKEGVLLDQKLQGSMHLPFEQRYSGGPYMIGEELERTDYRKRVYNLNVLVGPGINYLTRTRFPDNEFAYRMLEEKWWADWPENKNAPAGFWGTYTRTHGWRWIRVRHGEANDQTLDLDPTAYGNNCQAWAMTIHGQFPFYSKRAYTTVWANNEDNDQVNGVNTGLLALVNAGDWKPWPKYIVEGAGHVTIQDGITDRMVELPEIFATDGLVLVDTDPAARTLTGSKDPVDNLFYQLIRNSEILDYILGDLTKADSGLPVGRRMPGGIGFASPIPAKAVTHVKVTHTNPAGKITAVVPQWYRMGFA
ncbi:hypothetical protein A5755_26975 [Mycolicibacterium fortuitum]|nr:hypothetical protein A5755_26975 [Mycolicibacterium fortuitum]